MKSIEDFLGKEVMYTIFLLLLLSYGKILGQEVVISVGKETFNKSQIFDEFSQKYPKETAEVLQEMVVFSIIRQEAVKEGVVIPLEIIQEKAKQELQEFQKNLQQPWTDYLKALGVSEKKIIQKLLRKWKHNLAMEQLVRLSEMRQPHCSLRHILTNTQEKATNILQKVRQSNDFASIAQQESLSETRYNGGKLSYVSLGDFEESIEQQIFALKPQEISGVLSSPYGFHIFQMLQNFPGNPTLTWSQAKAELSKSLQQRPVTERDFNRWLEKMNQRYTIKKKIP